MKITWIGHSCFKVEKDGYTIIFDPYQDGSIPGLTNIEEKADLVLCSHDHFDHGAAEVVDVTDAKEVPFEVTVIDSFHDDQEGTLRGKNKIHIVDFGDERIAHMGDIGCDVTPEQTQLLKGVDVMLVPVGGFFTVDAFQAARLYGKIVPKRVIPMHYRDDFYGFGFDKIGTVDPFTMYLGSAEYTESPVYDTSLPKVLDLVILKPQNIANNK